MAIQKRSKPPTKQGQNGSKKGKNIPQKKGQTLGRKDGPISKGSAGLKHPRSKSNAASTTATKAATKRKKNQMDWQEEKGVKKPRDGEVWSKSKKKRVRALKAKQKRTGMAYLIADAATVASATTKRDPAASSQRASSNDGDGSRRSRVNEPELAQDVVGGNSDPADAGLSKLQKSFRDRLSGSRFRILNEELYTTPSTEALQRFQDNPLLFDEYHEGFRQQVSHWPVNPVSLLVDKIRRDHHATSSQSSASSSSSTTTTTTKRKNKKSLVVADFGCGDASLARQLLPSQLQKQQPEETKVAVVVHSFDLVARGPNADLITACDSASTPLKDATVDVGVFCLSLMGTNLADFIREAHRVLKHRGILHIAEVRSRFEDGGRDDAEDSTSLQHFIKTLDKLGFECSHVDRSNTMFVLMELRKNGKPPDQTLSYTAKPCIYKRR